jgi:hypothetical protein
MSQKAASLSAHSCSDMEVHLQDVYAGASDHVVVPHCFDPHHHLRLVSSLSCSWLQQTLNGRPPNEEERKHGQTYPHAFLWKPLLVGVFASCTVQTMRVPVWVMVSWFRLRPGTVNYL